MRLLVVSAFWGICYAALALRLLWGVLFGG